MPRTTRDFATLELTQSAYDEIEAKLLAAGYEHLFAAGPGSAIDLQGIAVTREAVKEITPVPPLMAKPYDANTKWRVVATGEIVTGTYCFMCDEMVSAPCDRENCLRRANDRVRAELGLVP